MVYQWILACLPSIIAIISTVTMIVKTIKQFADLKKEVVDLKSLDNLKAVIEEDRKLQNEQFRKLEAAYNEVLTELTRVKHEQRVKEYEEQK